MDNSNAEEIQMPKSTIDNKGETIEEAEPPGIDDEF
jgi:hypothetical protein